MRDIVKPTVVLLLICSIVTLALAFTNTLTKDKIDEAARIEEDNAKREVLALAESFEEIQALDAIVNRNEALSPVKKAFVGLKGEDVVGRVFITETKGYGGTIKITVGIDSEGTITKVKIGDNNETPGLGAKAKDEPFISQFENIAPKERLTVVKNKKSKDEEINAISGATITSKAVTKAVQAALDVNAELEKAEGDL
ncbi:MAG TPA: RnfABCDGE type electron transport complex subunit G [Acetivibrio sp.]|uniref:RnfABCDGE type electron transport complex subunit G n=1 Tax=Acetivibrio sp. TaxID=1872092 RepID=UPI002BC71B31|nr:RnfABCDGE type electron transport complex subunit G [Acetivibrio sp.]HOM03192.1 RnfABCDGE type electron transport complex subunit G [Acetivibrio sp.]